MTAKNQKELNLTDIDMKKIEGGYGKELNKLLDKDLIDDLIKEGIYEPAPEAKSHKPGPIIGDETKEALKKIPIPQNYLAKTSAARIKALKIVYKDLKNNKTSKNPEYWPSDLCHFSKKNLGYKIRKKDYFFFGWLLIQAADFDKKKCKKPIKNNWWIVCILMELITGKEEFINDYDSKDKRKDLYRIVKKYIKILLEAGTFKYKFDSRLESLKIRKESFDKLFSKYPREMIGLEIKYGYDLNLAHRIHAFLKGRYSKSKKKRPVRIGDIYDRFSNKRKNDIYPCLMFLERIGEIVIDKNKKIYYIGDGKDLKELRPTVFPDFFRSELS